MNLEIQPAKIFDRDTDTYEAVMREYGKLLWVIAGGILKGVGTPEDIEECVSDAYIRLWKNPRRFVPERGSLKTYLAVMVRSIALDRYRKLKKQKEQELEDFYSDEGFYSDETNPFEQVTEIEKKETLHNAVFALKEPDREIIIRRYYFDQKPIEIADQMGVQAKEVRNRLYQGKERLKKMIQGKETVL